MNLPVTALLPLALALLLISALGFDLLRRLGHGRRPAARGARRPTTGATSGRGGRSGNSGRNGHGGRGGRVTRSGSGLRGGTGVASAPSAESVRQAPRPPSLPDRRSAPPSLARPAPVASAKAVPAPGPQRWAPPPRANDSRYDSRWNSSQLDSRWLNLSVRPADARTGSRQRPAAPVLPFPRRKPGAWSLAAAGQGLQPAIDPAWDEGPARSDGGPETLPLRPPSTLQRRQPRR